MIISKTYEFHCHFGLSALSGLTGLTELNEYRTKLFIEMLLSAKGTRPELGRVHEEYKDN